MKFRITKPNVKKLCEAKGWKEFYGNNASIAADIIEEILKDPTKYDLTPEEINQLNIAYNILFDCAPHVQESLKEKLLKEGYNRGDVLSVISTLEDIAYWDTKNRCELSKEDLQKIFDVLKILKGIPSYLPFEESLKEAADQRVRLYVEFYPYTRYGPEEGLKKATVSGTDKLDALKKLVDHMGLYIDSEVIEEEGYSFEDCINSIRISNGDGCDFINVLMDKTTGEKFIDEGYNEEEDWDDDFDESLKEAKDVNLSDKSNSISGLLLDNKDKIDAAASQQELVKVCKDALAEKGGAKAQQFLAVLASKKGHYAALKYVYDFILAGEGMRSADSRRKTGVRESLQPSRESELYNGMLGYLVELIDDSDELVNVLRRIGFTDEEIHAELDWLDENFNKTKTSSVILKEDFSTEQDLIDAGFEQAGYRKNYDFYRKLINGKGKWYAVDTKDGRVFPITWDQAVGYEPIDSTEGMAMKLGSMLLPH